MFSTEADNCIPVCLIFLPSYLYLLLNWKSKIGISGEGLNPKQTKLFLPDGQFLCLLKVKKLANDRLNWYQKKKIFHETIVNNVRSGENACNQEWKNGENADNQIH